jgi:hypothetical protein
MEIIKKILIIVVVTSCMWFANKAFSRNIAWLPNQGGGKIIITDEPCVYNGQNYSLAKRIYNYVYSGASYEGCYEVNGENIQVIWFGDSKYYYYPLANLTFYK